MPVFWEAVGILFVISFLWSLVSLRSLLSEKQRKAGKGSVIFQSK